MYVSFHPKLNRDLAYFRSTLLKVYICSCLASISLKCVADYIIGSFCTMCITTSQYESQHHNVHHNIIICITTLHPQCASQHHIYNVYHNITMCITTSHPQCASQHHNVNHNITSTTCITTSHPQCASQHHIYVKFVFRQCLSSSYSR